MLLLPPSSSNSVSQRSVLENRLFGDLTRLQWRINLGMLSSSSTFIDDLRRVTADPRRRPLWTVDMSLLHLRKSGNNSSGLLSVVICFFHRIFTKKWLPVLIHQLELLKGLMWSENSKKFPVMMW